MESFIYPSILLDIVTGGVDFMRDDFSVMLLGPDFRPDRSISVRGELSDEVAAPGYSRAAVETDILVDHGSEGLLITLGGAVWPASTIKASYAAYFRNDGNELADSLIALIGFGGIIQSIDDTFTLTETQITVRL